MLDIVVQAQRDTEAAQSFLTRLPGEYAVPEAIHTDHLRSDGAAIQEPPVLHGVEHHEVASTAHCNNLTLQSHRPTRRQERSQLGFKRPERAQECLKRHARITNVHQHTRTTVPALTRRRHQNPAFQTWREVAGGVA
ncbi:putative transposase [Deinococcus humi]|uniref:Putative transposase n=1 Tax=Deinococcus humi TaxID=662880 RepID=A0A7W8JVL5_9DEIO|nr:putative transposase [Deinococcus humi]GGO29952.1 hypothetical protein GCM10008949_24150 [Deinococcus humi]